MCKGAGQGLQVHEGAGQDMCKGTWQDVQVGLVCCGCVAVCQGGVAGRTGGSSILKVCDSLPRRHGRGTPVDRYTEGVWQFYQGGVSGQVKSIMFGTDSPAGHSPNLLAPYWTVICFHVCA